MSVTNDTCLPGENFATEHGAETSLYARGNANFTNAFFYDSRVYFIPLIAFILSRATVIQFKLASIDFNIVIHYTTNELLLCTL